MACRWEHLAYALGELHHRVTKEANIHSHVFHEIPSKNSDLLHQLVKLVDQRVYLPREAGLPAQMDAGHERLYFPAHPPKFISSLDQASAISSMVSSSSVMTRSLRKSLVPSSNPAKFLALKLHNHVVIALLQIHSPVKEPYPIVALPLQARRDQVASGFHCMNAHPNCNHCDSAPPRLGEILERSVDVGCRSLEVLWQLFNGLAGI
jgi:hypothetical protein